MEALRSQMIHPKAHDLSTGDSIRTRVQGALKATLHPLYLALFLCYFPSVL